MYSAFSDAFMLHRRLPRASLPARPPTLTTVLQVGVTKLIRAAPASGWRRTRQWGTQS